MLVRPLLSSISIESSRMRVSIELTAFSALSRALRALSPARTWSSFSMFNSCVSWLSSTSNVVSSSDFVLSLLLRGATFAPPSMLLSASSKSIVCCMFSGSKSASAISSAANFIDFWRLSARLFSSFSLCLIRAVRRRASGVIG